MTVLSCNAANVRNKLFSLGKIVNSLDLSLFCLQETFMTKEGNMKFENSQNYHIFEQVRKDKWSPKTLRSKWVNEANEPAEA